MEKSPQQGKHKPGKTAQNQRWSQWCWWRKVGDISKMLVTESGFRQNSNILDPSPTHFVSNMSIRHQHQILIDEKYFVGKSSWGTYFIELMFEKISRLKLRLKTFSADFEIIFRNQKMKSQRGFLYFDVFIFKNVTRWWNSETLSESVIAKLET